IHHGFLTDNQTDPFSQFLFETPHGRRNLIRAYRKQRHIVSATLVAEDSSCIVTLVMLDSDFQSGDQRARSVLPDTHNGCRLELSKNRAASQSDQYNDRCYESLRWTESDIHPP